MQDRITHILNFMEYDQLTDAQHSLVVSLEEQFERKGTLSDKQMELLESIFERANERG